jgi:hypothetical protein
MSTTQTASEQIVETVSAWPQVQVGPNARGGLAFFVGSREFGHLHGDHVMHTWFPKERWHELEAAGRISEHPVFPGRVGPAARRITGAADIADVILLLRINYDGLLARDARSAQVA